jgi:hypothetical protein
MVVHALAMIDDRDKSRRGRVPSWTNFPMLKEFMLTDFDQRIDLPSSSNDFQITCHIHASWRQAILTDGSACACHDRVETKEYLAQIRDKKILSVLYGKIVDFQEIQHCYLIHQ